MQNDQIVLAIFFLVLSAFLIFPSQEFISIGLTVESLFRRFIKTPDRVGFTQFQLNRINVHFFFYAHLPLLYLGLNLWNTGGLALLSYVVWQIYFILSAFLSLLSIVVLIRWTIQDYKRHPFIRLLQKYDTNWNNVAADIDQEYKHPMKLELRLNTISSIVLTENWIIKTMPYRLHLIHKSDSTLTADRVETHSVNEEGEDLVQFVNIQVKSSRSGIPSFSFRLRSFLFREIQSKLEREIVVMPQVKLLGTIMDRFLEAFRAQIELNPRYQYRTRGEELDSCFACMLAQPNVKLKKNCADEEGEQNEDRKCKNCFCRPMWCDECLVQWFVARQTEKGVDRHYWLEQKSTCPMCRSRFCLLDVCYIDLVE